MIELLSPAKNKEIGKMAIDYGADAVYLGAQSFGARQNASNSLEDIEELIQYAHKFNVKTYVTVNTILNDEEVIKAQDLIHKLSYMNADGIIIQDFGLLEVPLPPIPIFASTQCHNNSLEKIQFLEKIGIQRVILARELNLEEIGKIAQNTKIEIETFIHGALCVSYSGQCYLSHHIGGRSANRGACAQPCRKKYSLYEESGSCIAKNKHLLSMKDFCAEKHLEELIKRGVTSFKIEGRLKDESYIKNTVLYYRKKIDMLAPKSSSGKIISDFTQDIHKTFNRGFSEYFINGRTKDHFCFETPKSKGEYLGKAKNVKNNSFELENSTLKCGDGICFLHNENLEGCFINKIEKNRAYSDKKLNLKENEDIFRNFDIEFEKTLKNSKTKRKIEANIELFAQGQYITTRITDENNFYIETQTKFESYSQNPESMLKTFEEQFKKTGESDFIIDKVKFDFSKVPFLKISEINQIRRELTQQLGLLRVKKYLPKKADIKFNNEPYPFTELDYRANVLNKYALNFYKKHGTTIAQLAPESGEKIQNKCLMTTKHCLKDAYNLCKTNKKLYLEDETGKAYKLEFDCKKCEMKILE